MTQSTPCDKTLCKVKTVEELIPIVESYRTQGKKIVHCHGCFDLMHPGHIKYLQAAKRMGQVLIVTLTADEFIDKGPNRPVFGHNLRAECLAALECVDYVAVNRQPTAENLLRCLRPNFYVKGQEFENLEDKTGKIQREYDVASQVGCKIRFTNEIVFSSTKLLNEHFLCNQGALNRR